MAATFVPFFEKIVSGDSVPQYQFNQYKLSKVTLAPTPNAIPHIDRTGLRTMALSDLRNAVRLALPDDSIQALLAEAAKYRPGVRPLLQGSQMDGEASIDPESSEQSETPRVELKKDGDKITQIAVECVCGQVIGLDCVY